MTFSLEKGDPPFSSSCFKWEWTQESSSEWEILSPGNSWLFSNHCHWISYWAVWKDQIISQLDSQRQISPIFTSVNEALQNCLDHTLGLDTSMNPFGVLDFIINQHLWKASWVSFHTSCNTNAYAFPRLVFLLVCGVLLFRILAFSLNWFFSQWPL